MRITSPSTPFHQVIAMLTAWSLMIIAIPFHPTVSVRAFMPNAASKHVNNTPNSCSHENITKDVINEYDKALFGLGSRDLTNDMKAARDKISDANVAVDSNFAIDRSRRTATFISAQHFDAENFQGGQKILTDKKTAIRMALLNPAADANALNVARQHLGQALHTLQDFYSHSNWVELGNTGVHPTLGTLRGRINSARVTTQTCTDCARNNCNDCYDPNRTPRLDNMTTTTALTSGYYRSEVDLGFLFGRYTIVEDRNKPNKFKCSHGGKARVDLGLFGGIKEVTDLSGGGDIGNGINKDTENCTVSPHSDKHFDAARLAKLATKKYLDEIKFIVGVPKMKLLLGGATQLAFAVDTTGSMTDEIERVKQEILRVVDYRLSIGIPSRYVLMPFNDPLVGPITATDDPEVFKAAVRSLTAALGDDCPELPNTAALEALDAMDGGDLVLFTDATAGDAGLATAVRALARFKGIGVTNVFSGGIADCPFDPGYALTSSDTGGQSFLLSPNETGGLVQFADFNSRPDTLDLLAINGTLSGAGQTYSLPVDSTLTQATFVVSGTGAANVLVRRPDGTTVQPTDQNVSYISLSSGAIYSIASPAVGTWSVTVSGSGSFSLRATGESQLDFSFDFVEWNDISIHGGFYPIVRFPLAGQGTFVSALLSSLASTAQFEFRGLNGVILGTFTLGEPPFSCSDGNPTSPIRAFFGNVTVPATPFRIYATGLDANGTSYQRVIPAVTKPQTIDIAAPPPQELHPGTTTDYKFQVKNTGTAGTFQFSGVDTYDFIASINPATFTLGTDETKEMTVELLTPPDTPTGVIDALTVNVQRTGTSEGNYAIVNSEVVAPTLTLGAVTPRVRVGDDDLLIEPNEIVDLRISLRNLSGGTATNVLATLTTETPGVTITSGTSAYFDLPFAGDTTSLPTGDGMNRTPFTFITTDQTLQTIDFALSVTYDGVFSPQEFLFTVPTTLPGPPLIFSYTGPPVAIPDGNVNSDGPPVNIPITVTGVTSTIADINFRIDGSLCTAAAGATTVGIDHTYVVDLVVKLTSPQGTTVTLIDGAGGGLNDGNNFCQTILDDEGGLTLIDLILPVGPPPLGPPYTGTFIPEYPLAAFLGEDANGIWTLTVIDRFAEGTGNVRAFSLVITTHQ